MKYHGFFLILVSVSSLTQCEAWIKSARAESALNLSRYEDEWAQAQQKYYDALKKLKTPRDPAKVKALKDEILTPSKQALSDAYERHAKSLLGSSSSKNGKDRPTDTPSGNPVEPIVILDGAGVKKEVRYLKKGAPVDMTEEESPDFEGPQVLASPSAENAGEIAYPVRKKKPAQGLKNKAP